MRCEVVHVIQAKLREADSLNERTPLSVDRVVATVVNSMNKERVLPWTSLSL